MATSERPRAIVLVNACCSTLTAFSHGDAAVAWANAPEARIRELENVTNAGRRYRETNLFRMIFFIAGEFLSNNASRPASGLEGKLSPDRSARRRGSLVGGTASRREVAPSIEFADTPGRGEQDWQQFRSGAEVPSLSFTACLRRIQRELPSTLTNGQKVDRTFQRKTFHGLLGEPSARGDEPLLGRSVLVPSGSAAS